MWYWNQIRMRRNFFKTGVMKPDTLISKRPWRPRTSFLHLTQIAFDNWLSSIQSLCCFFVRKRSRIGQIFKFLMAKYHWSCHWKGTKYRVVNVLTPCQYSSGALKRHYRFYCNHEDRLSGGSFCRCQLFGTSLRQLHKLVPVTSEGQWQKVDSESPLFRAFSII